MLWSGDKVVLMCLLLERLADLEFRLSAHRSNRKKQIFRELYLKFMGVEFENPIYFGHQIYIRNRGNLTFGKCCSIGSYTRIWNYAPIKIGDDFIGAGGLVINSGTHVVESLVPQVQEIVIGDRVWCGVNVSILSGVKIGNDVVIGAGSLVNSDIPSEVVVAGIPAKKIRNIQRSEVNMWSPFN